MTKTVQIDPSVILGHFSVLGPNVKLGKDCQIGHHVVIHEGTQIGNNVRIDDHAVIGKLPMKAANSALTLERDLPPAQIESNAIIGTSAIVYRGASIGKNVLVADLATVRENVKIGDYTIVGRGVAIESDTTVGAYCKLETNAYITAFSTIEDHCFVAPCVATSNDEFMARGSKRFGNYRGVTIKKGGRIGVQATILPGRTVAEDSLVAAGSVLTCDTQVKKIHMGSPARVIRDVPVEQWLENQFKREPK